MVYAGAVEEGVERVRPASHVSRIVAHLARQGKARCGLIFRAIAEAFVSPERKRLYAAPDTLGQIFSFDMLFCDFDAKDFRRVIERQLRLAKQYQTGSTWVLSSHDVSCRVNGADDRSFGTVTGTASLHTARPTWRLSCNTTASGCARMARPCLATETRGRGERKQRH